MLNTHHPTTRSFQSCVHWMRTDRPDEPMHQQTMYTVCTTRCICENTKATDSKEQRPRERESERVGRVKDAFIFPATVVENQCYIFGGVWLVIWYWIKARLHQDSFCQCSMFDQHTAPSTAMNMPFSLSLSHSIFHLINLYYAVSSSFRNRQWSGTESVYSCVPMSLRPIYHFFSLGKHAAVSCLLL